MAIVRRNIRITTSQNEWVREQVRKGNYTTECELFRALIQRAKEKQQLDEAIMLVLKSGKSSNGVTDFDPPKFSNRLIADYVKNGNRSLKHD